MQLFGVLLIVVGFLFRLDTIFVVVFSGIITGLLAGMSITDILTFMGEKFTETRYISIFFLTLPVIGVCERYGLREYASNLVEKLKSLNIKNILIYYFLARVVSAALSLRLQGHTQFVRPIVYPMLESLALKKKANLTDKETDQLKAMASAMENYSNFFGQNVFIGNGGVLLIIGTMAAIGVNLNPVDIALVSLIGMGFATMLAVVQSYIFERKFNKELEKIK